MLTQYVKEVLAYESWTRKVLAIPPLHPPIYYPPIYLDPPQVTQ